MLYQNVLFNSDEINKIRGYVTKLDDRIIGTYHPSVNNGEHDPIGGHNLAQHIPWSSSDEYKWISERILNWCSTLPLPYVIINLGWEFIVQKYIQGFQFKPHIDDVLSSDKKTLIRARYYTILIQFSNPSDYEGGELWVNDGQEDIMVNNEIGNVSIFDQGRLHWVTPITLGERWSCTIFLEKDAIKLNKLF